MLIAILITILVIILTISIVSLRKKRIRELEHCERMGILRGRQQETIFKIIEEIYNGQENKLK